ncbi:hypothetical protein Tco_1522897 [Tanacetum coccineum]
MDQDSAHMRIGCNHTKNKNYERSYTEECLVTTAEKRLKEDRATRKTQRNLLKQQYENFTALSSEMLDQTFDMLQKLVSQLEHLLKSFHKKDVNRKRLLEVCPPVVNTHAVVWRVSISDYGYKEQMDDLYNQKNLYKSFTASTQVNAANSTNIDNLSDAVIFAFFANANGHVDNEGKRAPRNQDNKNKESLRKSMLVETSTSTALVSCDGFGGYDWSDQAKRKALIMHS